MESAIKQFPTNDRSYKTIVDPKDKKELLIDCNLNHYAQAENTMSGHLICKKLGIYGTSTFCNNILEGAADLNKLPITLQVIFQQQH
jgi:hypothetical protein